MKISGSDIINTILSIYPNADIKYLVSITYYNSKERVELLFKPNEPIYELTRNNIHNLIENGFFVVTFDEGNYNAASKIDYHQFIEELRQNKLKEIGI